MNTTTINRRFAALPTRLARFGIAASVMAMMAIAPAAASAAATVNLATAAPYGVLGGTTVTNTGPTVINGNLGVNPGLAITGFPPGIVNGETHAGDAVSLQAQNDLTTAYNDAASRPSTGAIAADLAGSTLLPGVYTSASGIGLTGALTLDGQGDAGAVFIFQAGSTLTTGAGSSVVLINGAQACNVFWQVGSSATLGTGTAFQGSILALTSITANTSATVAGRLLARNGSTTLDTNTITAPTCAAAPAPPPDGGTDGGTDGTGGTGGGTPDGGGTGGTDENGTPLVGPTTDGRAFLRTPTVHPNRCVDTRFRARVTGRDIARVVFRLNGRVISTRSSGPYRVSINPKGKRNVLTARVFFKDATPARTLRLRYVACAEASRNPSRNPIRPPAFTG